MHQPTPFSMPRGKFVEAEPLCGPVGISRFGKPATNTPTYVCGPWAHTSFRRTPSTPLISIRSNAPNENWPIRPKSGVDTTSLGHFGTLRLQPRGLGGWPGTKEAETSTMAFSTMAKISTAHAASQRPTALAGLTTHGPMFCFAELARDVMMRVVYRAEHRPADGAALDANLLTLGLRETVRAALFDMDRTLVRKETASLYVRYQRELGEALANRRSLLEAGAAEPDGHGQSVERAGTGRSRPGRVGTQAASAGAPNTSWTSRCVAAWNTAAWRALSSP